MFRDSLLMLIITFTIFVYRRMTVVVFVVVAAYNDVPHVQFHLQHRSYSHIVRFMHFLLFFFFRYRQNILHNVWKRSN